MQFLKIQFILYGGLSVLECSLDGNYDLNDDDDIDETTQFHQETPEYRSKLWILVGDYIISN